MAVVRKRTLVDGKTTRWDVHFRGTDEKQRIKTFVRKLEADAFADSVETDKRRGQYVDPIAGKVTFQTYATEWLEMQTFSRSSREGVELRFRRHVFPVLGARQLGSLKPSTI